MSTKRQIVIFTGSRADYSGLYWLIKRVHADPDLTVKVLVTGTHTQDGNDRKELIKKDHMLTDYKEIELLPYQILRDPKEDITVQDIASSMSWGIAYISSMFTSKHSHKPDIIAILGDRPEVLAVAIAALFNKIPVAHLHGGESSEGSTDEQIRHAVTKLSHMHFVATQEYAHRLHRMGEEEWRVHTVGATSLEALYHTPIPSIEEVSRRINLDLSKPTLLITYHPATLANESVTELTEALNSIKGMQMLVTLPGFDEGSIPIANEFTKSKHVYGERYSLHNELGRENYFGAMKYATAMVGNSSSGIIEAASFGLPVVNVGDRQKGRIRGANVIDTPCLKESILSAIQKATSEQFRSEVANINNPYDHGPASDRILQVLKEVPLGTALLQKRFSEEKCRCR